MSESIARSQALLNSASGSAFVALVWEWLITLDDEVELIWSKPKHSWVKWLFLFARYYVLAAATTSRSLEAAVLYEYQVSKTCMKVWYALQVVVALHAMCSLEIILMARVYALYGKPIWMKFLFFSLVLAENIVVLIGILLTWPENFGLGDVVDRLPASFTYFGICTLVIQVVIMWLTISKYSHASWKTVPILRLMFRDGTLAFTILTGLVVVMSVLTIRHKPYAVAGNSWLLAAISGVTCRLIINMLKLVPSTRNRSNSASAGIQFTTIIASERTRTFDFSDIDGYDFSRIALPVGPMMVMA
ncbi:hypothetical protein FA13DRAFT_1657125 [Coprinellus micaceus]|uniref:DUF6533 domain-containing protein n=1 Tax=Coprinellus micaceus TaxID=71717 RepID=A0A4Y7TX51_COPMI|nr:hypothetical protein FA13DRAFT_1657125 [Coprinellus micaceus]